MSRLRRLRSDESGVVLLIVAGMLVAVLGMAALAIDISSFYKAQRQAQSAADAGALAASQDLPGSPSSATTDGTNYATTNYPGSTVGVTTNYNSQTSEVKVSVSASTPSFFGNLLGLTHANVSASAVAGGNGSAAPAAIFAYDDACGNTGVALNGNAADINGAVISNGSLSEAMNPSGSVSTATYGGPNGCKYTDNGKGSFGYGPTVDANLTAFPVDYSKNPPTCTVPAPPTQPAASIVWDQSNITIPSGVYCANEIDITGNNITATGVTFIANKIVITGNHATLAAPNNGTGLLFWQTGTSTISVGKTGNNITFNGAIYAPSATVDFVGNSSSNTTGFVEANDVIVDGNSFSITGTGPVMGGNGNSLIQ